MAPRLVLTLALALLPAQSFAQTPSTVAPSNADADWRPTSAQMEIVLRETRAYFAARDEGRLQAAYDKFSPAQKEAVPYDGWREVIESFNARSGGVTSRLLRQVTWYKDPPQARPGVYAAIDFSSESPHLALHCGYVVLWEQPDGSFLVIREEDNVLDRKTESRMKAVDLARVRLKFGC